MINNLLSALCVIGLVLPCWSAQASEEDFTNLIYSNNSPVAHADPLQFAQFSMFKRELQHMLYALLLNGQTNNFCLVGYTFANGDVETVIFWEEDKSLRTWTGGSPLVAKEHFREASSILLSPRIGEENLFDRMPDPPYFLGGEQLASRTSFYATIDDCKRHGQRYQITPFIPSESDMER